MAITAADIEMFSAHQEARDIIRQARLLDASTPRVKGRPTRIETLRAMVASKMGISLAGGEDDGELTREPARSKSSTSMVVKKDNVSRETRIKIDNVPEMQLLANQVLYAKSIDGEFIPVMRIE